MGRSTVTGKKEQSAVSSQQSAAEDAQPVFAAYRLLPPAYSRRGFTLLELMIVISIIVILALIVLPQYRSTVQTTKEAVLRDDLHQMRKMIDQFTADKGRRPRSLSELVSEGYLDKIPEDPMTEREEWYEVPEDNPDFSEGGGIKSVCSLSSDTALDKTQYNDCDRW